MEETKLTAALPNLDVEILHREEPEGAETVVIRITATPSFEAAARMLAPALCAMPAAMLWTASMQAWSELAWRSWAPWLGAVGPTASRLSVLGGSRDRGL